MIAQNWQGYNHQSLFNIIFFPFFPPAQAAVLIKNLSLSTLIKKLSFPNLLGPCAPFTSRYIYAHTVLFQTDVNPKKRTKEVGKKKGVADFIKKGEKNAKTKTIYRRTKTTTACFTIY